MSKHIIIVGGVAGGMSCAARLKRLNDSLTVSVFEKGPDVSFANCGMPYYIGGIISDRAAMLVQTPERLAQRYGIDVHVRHEVTSIDRDARTVTVTNLASGCSAVHTYDVLVLATGAAPLRPPIAGADLEHVFVLNNLADMDAIRARACRSRRACVVGAGFIGLELGENLRHLGLEVAVVEAQDQVLPPLDKEMTQPLLAELALNKVQVHLSKSVRSIESSAVVLSDGTRIDADLVCLCVGVRPNSRLAQVAGLELGARGHIRVNAHMQSSDPNIYAVGDVVETTDFVLAAPTAVALAGPANRQGRIAADVICGRDASSYGTTQGTAIVKVFHQVAAVTGCSEKRLRETGLAYQRIYLHPMQHPGYYPGARPIALKLLFSREGRILGAQVVGSDGVDALINVLVTAMRAGQTVHDLEHLELAYSPQWGGAKHPLNMTGFVAGNVLRGDVQVFEADSVDPELFLLDVRNEAEAEAGTITGATVIPLEELRSRISELPRQRLIGVYCAVGLRGHIAARLLMQQGFGVYNLNGGFRTWRMFHPQPGAAVCASCAAAKADGGSSAGAAADSAPPAAPAVVVQLDVCGLQCPGPIARVKHAVGSMSAGQVLEVTATDPGFAADIPMWCRRTGNNLLEITAKDGTYVARISRGDGAAEVVTATASSSSGSPARSSGKTLICFSNDLDKVIATFIIANGAAAMGSAVTIFFTFWGLNVLRRESAPLVRKDFPAKMFGWMMPKGPRRLKLSKMHFAGVGTAMMKHIMKQKNVMSLEELIAAAQADGVRLVACAMSMDVMGICKEELIDGVEIAGVGHYLGTADDASVNLFI